jgi:hypothetical protein
MGFVDLQFSVRFFLSTRARSPVGMRRSEDIIWGIFKADNQTLRLRDLMQTVLENHGLNIDIVFEDTAFPLTDEYQHIYNWAQNVTER